MKEISTCVFAYLSKISEHTNTLNHSIQKDMKIFILSLLISTTLSAQNYENQHAKCSDELQLNGEIDDTYFTRLKERDACLKGTTAPNFTATTIDGKEIELSKLKGKVVVLNFWFTRCQPCIAEMPDLNKIVDHYTGKDVVFLSFAPEDKTKLEEFFQKHPFKFTAVPESETIRRDVFKLFSAWPYAVIIDKEGKIGKMWFGNSNKPKDMSIFDHYKNSIDGLL